jgi:hypothetical protein
LLEVQKIAYFLQEAGEPLRLDFQRNRFGPYARGLDKTLQRLEGHFIVGLGDDAKPDAEVDLLPGAVEAAMAALQSRPESRQRFDRVAELIEGFESPYGLELLASVHWVATRDEPPVVDVGAASAAIRSWTDRKATLFGTDHVKVAWERLASRGWIGLPAAR